MRRPSRFTLTTFAIGFCLSLAGLGRNHTAPRRFVAVLVLVAVLAGVSDLKEPNHLDAQVVLPVVVTKTFAPSTINAGGTSTLTITVSNPNGIGVDRVYMDDRLPAGLETVYGSGIAPCSPGVGFDSTTIYVRLFTLRSNSTCVITVQVTTNVPGTYVNTTGPTSIAFNDLITGPVSATLVVNPVPVLPLPPELALAFSPGTLIGSGETVLTYTIRNPNNNTALTNISFFDDEDCCIRLREPIGGSCGGSKSLVLLAPPGPPPPFPPPSFPPFPPAPAQVGHFKLSGLALGPLESCTITLTASISVTFNGIYTNTTKRILSNESGYSAAGASGGIQVGLLPPRVTKTFSKSTIQTGEGVRMTVTLTDPNTPTRLSSSFFPVGFTIPVSSLGNATVADSLPAGLAISANPNITHTPECGNTVDGATSGSVTLVFETLFGQALFPDVVQLSCGFSINLVSTGVIGNLTNTTGVPTSPRSFAQIGVPASASITVTGQMPSLTKAFGATSVAAGQPTNLTFTVANPNATPLTAVAFTDPLPASMLIATPPGVANTCGGTVSAPAAGTAIVLSGGTVASSSTCQVTVTVLAISVGSLVNQATAFSTAETGVLPAASATASLNVLAAPAGATPTPTPTPPALPVRPVIPQVFQNPAVQGIFNGPRNPAVTPQPSDPRPVAVAPAASLPVIIQPPRTGDAGLR